MTAAIATAATRDNDWWAIPFPDGCTCINLTDGECVKVWFLDELPQDIIKHGIDRLDCRPDDLRVFHFPSRIDVGIFHAVDRLLAKGLDGRPSIFAAFYGKSTKSELDRSFQSGDARDRILQTGCWHRVHCTSLSVDGVDNRNEDRMPGESQGSPGFLAPNPQGGAS